jgi:type I restriction enzyme S subunit
MGLLRPRLDEVNPRFLLYAYLAPEFQSTIRERTISGATVDRIPLNQMSSWPITIADRASQDAIAELLGALDDKIDLNRRTSATDQQLRSAMIEVTLRDSHADVPLTELATFVNGGAFTAHATGEGRPILRIRELSSGVDKQTPRTNMAVSQDHIAEPDTLLLAWSGSVGVHRWHGEQAVINQHIFKVLPKAPTWLVEYWLDRHVSWFRSIAADKATTMGHIQRHHLDEALCVVPDTIRLHELDKAVGPLYQLEHTLANETAALGSLRDALLPELISGRMTVNPDLSVRSGGSAR